LKTKLQDEKSKSTSKNEQQEFRRMLDSGKIQAFISERNKYLNVQYLNRDGVREVVNAIAFGLVENKNNTLVQLTDKGREFLMWYIIEGDKQDTEK
jgi:hypothetical protein